MSIKLNIIITLITLSIIVIYKIFQRKKYNKVYKDTLYYKTNKLIKILYLLSILIFLILIILNIFTTESTLSFKTILNIILNSLSISILLTPLTIDNLYITYFKDEEKYSHIKTIITNKIDKKLLSKFKKANINIILLSEDTQDLKLNTIEEKDFKKSYLSKNIHIKTDNLKLLDKYINKENTIKEFKNLNSLYETIYKARGTHDNYIRNLKYILFTYLSIIVSFIFFICMGFPLIYNLSLALILKLFTILTSNYIYKYLPYDKDIMERKVKDKNILLGKQEIFFTIIQSFCISFAASIPYMYTLSQGATQALGNTLYFLIFIYAELFMIFSNLSDSFILVNIFKSIKNLRLVLFTIISILLVLFFNFIGIFETRNVYLKNNISSFIFSFIPIIFNELTKLSRYLSMKGKKKHELKNNKKHKRS